MPAVEKIYSVALLWRALGGWSDQQGRRKPSHSRDLRLVHHQIMCPRVASMLALEGA